jgi:hypothetical protein
VSPTCLLPRLLVAITLTAIMSLAAVGQDLNRGFSDRGSLSSGSCYINNGYRVCPRTDTAGEALAKRALITSLR